MTADVAVLAPVPLEHLESGKGVCASKGKVAFGSRDFQFFRRLDELRGGLPVDVYIYPSHAKGPRHFEARWHARYIGHVESEGGAHPAKSEFRPPSTEKWPEDNLGHWAVFWEVADLRELPEGERLNIRDLRPHGGGKYYGRGFVPEGPILIEHP